MILGHWLVTALVLTTLPPAGPVLHDDSPLASMPWLAPVSWIFQTLAVFFLVGGYSAARGYRGASTSPGCASGMIRLARPVAALAAVWVPVTAACCWRRVPATTVHTLLFLVISPLWFLGVYAVLTALTPAALGLVRRFGAWAAAFPAGVVAVTDLVRFGLQRARLGGLGQRRRRLARPLPARHRLGAAGRCAAAGSPLPCWPAAPPPPPR